MGTLARDDYQKLVRDIGAIYEDARKALMRAWWLIGQRIVEVEQGGAVRAPHGKGLLAELSKDLTRKHGRGFSCTNLKNMRRLYRTDPNRQAPDQLSVAHHVELLPVRDSKKRRLLEKRALREGLSQRQLRVLVREETSAYERKTRALPPPEPPELLKPVRGKLYTHRITEKGGELYLDKGFRNYVRLTPSRAAHFKKDDLVEALADGTLRKLGGEASAADLYTYEAKLDRVLDGDTQWYFILTGRPEADGAQPMKNEKLRLRGIDCPELFSAAGKAAKKFSEELFGRATGITVTTTKPDKFDRYLSDIFLRMADGTELFLNNELLKHGHACRYGDPRPEDWEA